MSLFTPSEKKKQEIVLVCDIASASVGAAFVKITDDSRPVILSSVRQDIPFQHDLSFEKFLPEMSKVLEIALEELHKKDYSNPDSIRCFLSSPWYASQTRLVNLKKDSPFTFTEKLTSELIEKEVRQFEESELKHYSSADDSVKLIEHKTIRITLNGYKTTRPIGKKITNLEVTLYLSMSPESVLNLIKKKISNVFVQKKIGFSSLPFSTFVMIRDTLSHDDAFLIVNVGEEITDISIVKEDILLESVSFPLGRNFLIRRIASEFGKTVDESASLISMYESGILAKNYVPRIQKILENAKSEWLKSFQKSLVSITTDLTSPDNLFLTSSDDVSSWFANIIKGEQFTQYMATDRKFNVIVLGKESLMPLIEDRGGLQDSFIMIESIFLKNIFK